MATAHQDLLDALDELHRAAGRPSHRQISTLVSEGDHPTTVSHEGVRQTLKGIRVPRWETVRSIVSVLASACVDPPRDPAEESARFLPLWRAVREGESGGMKSARELSLAMSWGGEDGRWTPEAVAGVLINPFNAVQIDPALAVPHEPILSEDEWVRLGLRTIEESGAEFFLRALLRILKGDYVGAERGSPYGYEDPGREAAETAEGIQYAFQEILRRLSSEPNLLQRSIAAARADGTMDREERADLLEQEADPALMREVMTVTPETWHEVSEEAHRMVFGYLVKTGETVGRPGLPPEQRFRITWRVPEPDTPRS
ncbi:hypothetical protein ABZ896_50545 [Streptomyces sp. NPDC047072]|uniref:hypothetical protein n=1 Tax=Streptomyces sp. NPDC047072 TaxID=3154809 RepID=UPI0033EBDFDC